MQSPAAVCALVLACLAVECLPAVVDLKKDFSNVQRNVQLSEHVKPILDRLRTFKVPIHPRIRIFYELLVKDVTNYAHRTADTLYNIQKYNMYTADDDRE